MTETETTSRRDRIRQLTQDEIKSIAMRQIAEGGVQHISMNAIAKEMGMSGPALYRYFENRHALLLDVVKDGFDSLQKAIMFADSMGENVVDRITAMAKAYRTWAQENSELYGLLFSTVIPGVEQQSLEPCMTCRDAVMPLVLAIVEYAEVDFTPDPSYEVDAENPYGDLPDDFKYIVIRIWARLHGLVMLELHGHLEPAEIDSDRVFELELQDTLALVRNFRENRSDH